MPFVLVLFSAHKILCVPYPEEYAQTAQKHLFSLQNYSFFWNCVYRKSSRIFLLAKAVFFQDLHWLKMIKVFDFSEQKLALDRELLTCRFHKVPDEWEISP